MSTPQLPEGWTWFQAAPDGRDNPGRFYATDGTTDWVRRGDCTVFADDPDELAAKAAEQAKARETR